MQIITVINAKGGCGKSTIAMNLAAGLAHEGHRTLLLDTDPSAQVTAWLEAGDGLDPANTLVPVINGEKAIADVIQESRIENLYCVASAEPLEDMGRQITRRENYHMILTHALSEVASRFDYCVIDSPNQISPIMENVIFPADLFIVPFDGTKAVRMYANLYKLLLQLRGDQPHILHVLSNLTKFPSVRRMVISQLHADGVELAKSEVRSSADLAIVDNFGGSILDYRKNSNGARDIRALTLEALSILGARTEAEITNEPAGEPATI